MVTLTIVPEPSDATVVLTAVGYTQEGNSISVPLGTKVSWVVSKPGYNDSKDQEVLFGNRTVSVKLVDVPMCTISVDATPSAATVSIRSTTDSYWDNNSKGNSLTLPIGTKNVVVQVSHPQLNTKTFDAFTVNETTNLTAVLQNTISVFVYDSTGKSSMTSQEMANAEIKDAIITINNKDGDTKSQACNMDVSWSVKKDGYESASGEIRASQQAGGFIPNHTKIVNGEDNRIKVGINKQLYTVTFKVTPSDAKIYATVAGGTKQEKAGSLTVQGYLGDKIVYGAYKEEYVPLENAEFTITKTGVPDPIVLNVKKYYVTVEPDVPSGVVSQCDVMIKSGNAVLAQGKGKQGVNVEKNTPLSYTVQKGTVIKTGSLTVTKDAAIKVKLAVGEYKAEAFLLNTADLNNGVYCYPIYANSSTAVVSVSGNNSISYSLSGGVATKTGERTDIGAVVGFSSFDSSSENMVFFSSCVDSEKSIAMKLSVNPNSNSITITESKDFGSGSYWGNGTFVKITQGWLGIRYYGTGSGANYKRVGDLRLDTTSLLTFGAGGTTVGTSDLSPRTINLSKKDASTAIGLSPESSSYNISKYTATGSSIILTDSTYKSNVFADSNGNIVVDGKSFSILNSSGTKIYSYNADENRAFELLGRISDYYYVLDYVSTSPTADSKTYIRIFGAGTTGLIETKEISIPNWSSETKKRCYTYPQISQTGFLSTIVRGAYASTPVYLIRVQGY